MKQHILTFESFINEDTHFYGPSSDIEKLAGVGSGRIYRYASSSALVAKVKKYFMKPEDLQKFSDGKVRFANNGRESFRIETKGKFDMDSQELIDTLQNFADRIMTGEGHFGVTFTYRRNRNYIFVEFDLAPGVTFDFK